MSWDAILGQERTKQLLQKILLSGTTGSAYLFWGSPGVGTDALAIEFAKALNCAQPQVTDNTFAACDRCSHCRQISQLQHPNLLLVLPLPTGKRSKGETVLDTLSEEQMAAVQQAIQRKAEDPYQPLEIPGAQSIKIQSIRDLRKTLSLTPAVPAGRRIVLILRADAMTTEAANALLKTLEEPHLDTTLLLTAERKDQLLPTILSRCQILRCDPLPEATIAQALQLRDQLPEMQAQLLAHLAEGDYARAKAMISADTEQLVALAIEFLRAALRRSQWSVHLSRLIEQLHTFDRTMQQEFFRILQQWLRLAWELQFTHAFETVPAQFQREILQKFVQQYSTANFPEILRAIDHTILALQRNQQLPLSIYSLVFRLRKLVLQQ